MIKRVGLVMMAIVMAVMAVTIKAQVRAEVALRAAVEQETVKGDLKGAIEAYRRIVDGYPENRPIRAEALVRMAECYQKLGDAQARASFERVIKEFADQPAAAEARIALARLAVPPSAAASLPSDRMLWRAPSTLIGFLGEAATDRPLIPYAELGSAGWDVKVYDVRAARSRLLLEGGKQPDGAFAAVGAVAFSRDGQQLAYSWSIKKNTDELRLLNLSARSEQKARVLLSDPTIATILPRDWAPDGRMIAAEVQRKDGALQVAVVSTESGALRVLGPLDVSPRAWPSNVHTSMRFSPDGTHLLFNIPGRTVTERDIVSISIKDGRRVAAVEFPGDDNLLGWTPDGKDLLFQSSRSGSSAIWRAPYHEGTTTGATLVRRDVPILLALGVSPSGALHYVAPLASVTDVKVGSFDPSVGRFTSDVVNVSSDRIGTNSAPRLSPEGLSLGYVSERPQGPVMVIRTTATGQTREFRLPLRAFRNANTSLWKWSSDGLAIYALGVDVGGRTGIHRIDVGSGKLAWTIDAGLAGLNLPHDLPGGRLHFTVNATDGARGLTIFEVDAEGSQRRELYRTADDCREQIGSSSIYCVIGSAIVRRDIRTGADIRVGDFEIGRGWQISPDERFLLTSTTVPGTALRAMTLTDLKSGETRELLRTEASLFASWWAPDGRALLAHKTGGEGKPRETWWIPTNGSAPHRIPEMDDAVFDTPIGRFSAGQLVFATAEKTSPPELWVLENFLPVSGHGGRTP